MTNKTDWWFLQSIFLKRFLVVYTVLWSSNQANYVTSGHLWLRDTSEENFNFKAITDKDNICRERYVRKWLQRERVFHFHPQVCNYILVSLNPVNLFWFWTWNSKVILLQLNLGYRISTLIFQMFLSISLKRDVQNICLCKWRIID